MAETVPSVDWPELRERSRQLAALTELLAAVAESGCGRLVLVYGEAGIGKTALTRSFSTEAVGSAGVLCGGCDELFTPRPLGPLFDIAGAAGRQLAEALEREATPYEVAMAVAERLAAILRRSLCLRTCILRTRRRSMSCGFSGGASAACPR